MRILQAKILEWVAMPSSRGSPQLRNGTQGAGGGMRAVGRGQQVGLRGHNENLKHAKPLGQGSKEQELDCH